MMQRLNAMQGSGHNCTYLWVCLRRCRSDVSSPCYPSPWRRCSCRRSALLPCRRIENSVSSTCLTKNSDKISLISVSAPERLGDGRLSPSGGGHAKSQCLKNWKTTKNHVWAIEKQLYTRVRFSSIFKLRFDTLSFHTQVSLSQNGICWKRSTQTINGTSELEPKWHMLKTISPNSARKQMQICVGARFDVLADDITKSSGNSMIKTMTGPMAC